MEFMAAYYIYLQVTKQSIKPLVIQKRTVRLSRTSFVEYMRSKNFYLRERATRKPTLKNILKRLHGGSLPDSLEKYQNLLFQTLSIFHVGEVEVPETAKIGALKLLEKSGLKDKDSFLKVMHNIKCNDRISRWIAQRFNLFDKNTLISDSSFESYIALLAATDPPLPNIDEIRIDIVLQEACSGFEVLSNHLCRHQVFPRKIFLRNHYEEFSSPNTEETESIKILLSKDCWRYKGIWSPKFLMPSYMEDLYVRLPNHASLDAFCESLEKTKRIRYLKIHFSVNDVSSVSRPIPSVQGNPNVDVYVSDVKEEDTEKVGDILRALQPQDASSSFYEIRFPRCSLRSPEEFIRLLGSLEGVRVRFSICLPTEKEPDENALREEMDLRAKDSTGCRFDIEWREERMMFS
ncbi:uncharacterized protein [Palaemon carinicauda]|uniref:uncharacterized protein n=1 Tax=Palaemon carinicauda TaxID=392227 RepID=UPI0035B634B8